MKGVNGHGHRHERGSKYMIRKRSRYSRVRDKTYEAEFGVPVVGWGAKFA